MKIAFNCLNSGLGNNGGSNTILKSQIILERLGHTCDVIATTDKFTWFDHKVPIPNLPHSGYDWIIATACTSVASTLKSKIKNKAWWIRAHETWAPNFDDKKLKKLYATKGIFKIVNSIWQKEFLESLGVNCSLVYQGIDISEWNDAHIRPKYPITICSLYSSKPRKNWCSFDRLMRKLGTHHYKFVSFGSEKNPKHPYISKYLRNPNHGELEKLFHQSHIYFAPTYSEGLHNIPMEAALCGTEIVCSDCNENGMRDYVIPDVTAKVYPFVDKQLDVAANIIRGYQKWKKKGYNDRMKSVIRNKIGNREHNMRKLISTLKSL